MAWVRQTLGEICRQGGGRVQTGPFGSQLHESDYSEEGTPVVMPVDIVDGKISTMRIVRVSDKHVDRLKRHKLLVGDIVYGRRGDIGRQALVREENAGWLCGTGCLKISLGDGPLDSDFLHRYLSTSAVIGWIEGQAIGATMPNLNTGILERIPVFYPEEKRTQEKIAAILSAYDDLIENNRRRIALLEKMAEEIYREWFVRMRFPGHEQAKFEKGVPEGWESGAASKFFGNIKGKSYGSDELTDRPEDMAFITLKSFNRGGGYRAEGLKHYAGKYKEEQIVRCGDVVMAVTDMTQNREVVGRVARVPDVGDRGAVISLDVIKLVPITVSRSYLYSYMRLSGFGEFIKEFANGTNVLHLKPELVTQQKIVMPPEYLRDKLVAIVEPIYEQVDSLNKVIDGLAATRDMLLPRLISGKLAVDNLDIHFPPSTQDASG